jgi:hypothetical protein
VTFYIAAGIFSFMVPAYFILLMADARRLRERLRERRIAPAENVQEEETPLIKLDGPVWTASPFHKAGTASHGPGASFYSSEVKPADTGESL